MKNRHSESGAAEIRHGEALLTGWGRISTSKCKLWKPRSIEEMITIFSKAGSHGLIGRGCGRSYGDVSTNDTGYVVDMSGMNEIEHFNEDTGQIVCESGVTMAALVSKYLDSGFVPPVCPGTGFVTVGGAVAHDVHGKNHEIDGSFGDHIDWLDLLLPSGELKHVNEREEPELFKATIGGAGMTGLITKVAFRMKNLLTNAMYVVEKKMKNLDHFMESLHNAMEHSPYNVGWIDAASRGAQLGRGILITGEPADGFLPVRKRRSFPIPFNMPPGMLNHLTVSIFNFFYYHRIGRGRSMHQDFERFVFPLDALLHWNRLYGTKGVYQFQCVIPHENAVRAMHELMVMASFNTSSPLAVIKILGGRGRGYLSFPSPGFTLALDFPQSRTSAALIQRMYDVTLSHGGRIYLAKDACLHDWQYRLMYPHANDFAAVLQRYDPQGIMQSDMSRRLSLRKVA